MKNSPHPSPYPAPLLHLLIFALSCMQFVFGCKRFRLYASPNKSSYSGLPAVIYHMENEGWRKYRLYALRDERSMVRKWAGKFRIASYYGDAHFL